MVFESERALEASGKRLVLEWVGKTALKDTGFNLDFLNWAKMGRTLKISFEFERGDCSAGCVLIWNLGVSHLPVLVGSVGWAKELVGAGLHFLVHAQGVLQVVTFAGKVRILDYAAERLRWEFIRRNRCESIFGQGVVSPDDFIFEAGRGASCVGFGEDILSFYARDEASVARHCLVANFVGGAH